VVEGYLLGYFLEVTYSCREDFRGVGRENLVEFIPDVADFLESLSSQRKARMGKETVVDAMNKAMPHSTLRAIVNDECCVLSQFVRMVIKMEGNIHLSLETFVSLVRIKKFMKLFEVKNNAPNTQGNKAKTLSLLVEHLLQCEELMVKDPSYAPRLRSIKAYLDEQRNTFKNLNEIHLRKNLAFDELHKQGKAFDKEVRLLLYRITSSAGIPRISPLVEHSTQRRVQMF
jgi:hypothetical protein